jgi:hypothetical protein
LNTQGPGDIPGPKPGSPDNWPSLVVTFAVLFAALLFFLHLFSRLRAGVQGKQVDTCAWRRIFWLLAPYSLAYAGALMLQAIYQTIFDRYLLTLQAFGIIVLLRYYQDFATHAGKETHLGFGIGRIPATSQLALLAFAFYGIAGTHDWFALNRARLEAAEEVRRSGVPRTAIQAGFEYDAWTQLEAAGHMNDPRIKIPEGAFHPVSPASDHRPECARAWFPFVVTPAVAPRYFVVYTPLACLAPSQFPPVTYHTWRPPFTRQLWVQEGKY